MKKTEEEKTIAHEYQIFWKIANKIFWKIANKLARQDSVTYIHDPKLEPEYDRMTKHLLGMMELFSIRYGPYNENLVVKKLAKRFVGTASGLRSTSHTEEEIQDILLSVLKEEEKEEHE